MLAAANNCDSDTSPAFPASSAVSRKLPESSWLHLWIVARIRTHCPRYDSPLLVDIERLHAACYRYGVMGSQATESVPATGLMLYR